MNKLNVSGVEPPHSQGATTRRLEEQVPPGLYGAESRRREWGWVGGPNVSFFCLRALLLLGLLLIMGSGVAAEDFPGVLLGKWGVSEAGQPDRELVGRWQGEVLELTGAGESFRFGRDGSGEHNGVKATGHKEGDYWLFDFAGTRYTFIGQDHKLAIQLDTHAQGYWQPQATIFLYRR